MLIHEYAIFLALAVGATTAWAILEKRIPMMAGAATAAWGVLALQPVVEVPKGVCCVYQYDATIGQFFGAGAAIISFGAFILYFLGSYPPTDDAPENPDPQQIAPDGGQQTRRR